MNPKAETVEELQGRRKNLHMGMCKLLKEDLALQAAARLAEKGTLLRKNALPDTSGVKECITKDFECQTQVHMNVDENTFNKDTEYKRLMIEAIDGKAYALCKLDIFLESVAAGLDQESLVRILNAPLSDFANQSTVLRLRTGISDFPWEAIVQERSAEIDLGTWNAAKCSAYAQEHVVSALAGNQNVHFVHVKGVKLDLTHGWATSEILWRDNAAVKELPATVFLLLRNCSCLSKLDVR